jgi:recombination protein RecT
MNKIQNQVNNQVATQNTEKKTMQTYIKSMEGEIKKALPSVITPERFTRMVLSAISVNPQLGSCTPSSFLGAMMSAAQLGLEPNTPLGQAYILPYKNKGVLEAQFQLGYKGLIDLAYRSGEVEVVQAHIVYENDEFTCEYGLEPKLTHVPADRERGNPIKVYAMFKTKSGGYGFEVMSIEDVKQHAQKYSKSYSSNYSPWTTNFEEMAKKTVLKKCLKYAPLKSDFVRGVVQDGSIKNEISEDMYEVSNVVVDDGDYVVVDTDTGEVVEE